jgi:hypothetical protein
VLIACAVVAVVIVVRNMRNDQPAAHSSAQSTAHVGPSHPDLKNTDTRTVSARERADALARAQAWQAPTTPIAKAALGHHDAHPAVIECRFTITDLGGTTPKFHCLLESGRQIRAKYGPGSEVPAEVAATRILSALGFGADTVTLVERLRCYGCPKEPFLISKAVEATHTRPLYERAVDVNDYEEFEWVSIEQKFEGRPIEAEGQPGWAFFELDTIDESKGGAPRAHVDALRLIAVFLAHWDNKPENQRLVCLSDSWAERTPCRRPFVLLQDVGATFGPRKVDRRAWEQARIWEDRATCTISMRDLPYDGATFESVRVSERGRRFLAGLLGQLTEAQLTDLFSGARFDKPRRPLKGTSPVSEWVRAFRARTRAISEGPPCPLA